MKNIRRTLVGLVLIGCALICTSCGAKKIPDETLKAAIQSWDSAYSDYGLTIKNFDVQSRNYDKKYATESVTVAVTAENMEATCNIRYEVVGEYGDKGQYGDRHWNIADVSIEDRDVSPKNSLPESRVEELAEELLQQSENRRSHVSEMEYRYDRSVQSTVPVMITLRSNIPFVETVCNYNVTFRYTLDGWECDDAESQEGQRTTRLTDDLCGTWSYVDEEGVSYGVVIDKVDRMTINMKCYTTSNKTGRDAVIRQLSQSTFQISMECLYDNHYRIKGNFGEAGSRENGYYTIALTIYPANMSSFNSTIIHGNFIEEGVCMLLGVYQGNIKDNWFRVGYLLTKQ